MKICIKPIFATLFFALASAQAATYDPVANFNPTNDPAGTFTYGVGGTPASFVLLTHITNNCIGTPSDCIDNGANPTSAVTWNGTAGTATYATIQQPNTELRLDPQNTAGTIVRFNAPTTGNAYSVSGQFQGIDTGQHSVIVKVFSNGTQQYTNTINSFGAVDAFNLTGLSLVAGQTVDFVVITNSDCCNLSTGLAATITSGSTAPEPSTWMLIGLSVPLLLVLRKHRAVR